MHRCIATENTIYGTQAGTARGFDLYQIRNGHYTQCYSSNNIGRAGELELLERRGSRPPGGFIGDPPNFVSNAESVGFSLFFNESVVVDRCTATNNSIKDDDGYSEAVSIGFLATDVTGIIDSCKSSFHGTGLSGNPNKDGVGFFLNNLKSFRGRYESFMGSQLIVHNCIAQNNLACGFKEESESSIAFLNNSAEFNTVNFRLLPTSSRISALIPIDTWSISGPPPSLSQSKWANYDISR